LGLLWHDLKQMFDATEGSGFGKPALVEIEGVDDYIRQLDELDPDSIRLRYPRSTRDVPSLQPNLNINLLHFALMMDRLADWFETLDMATYVLEEKKAEVANLGWCLNPRMNMTCSIGFSYSLRLTNKD
jgi:hypothetical protein